MYESIFLQISLLKLCFSGGSSVYNDHIFSTKVKIRSKGSNENNHSTIDGKEFLRVKVNLRVLKTCKAIALKNEIVDLC